MYSIFAFQIKWINDFHAKARRVLGPELKSQGKTDGYDWLMKNSEPLRGPNTNAGNLVVVPSLLFIAFQYGICHGTLYIYSKL